MPRPGLLWRVRGPAQFALFKRGRRRRSGPVSVSFVAMPAGPPRVAFAIGTSVGNAPERNRLRRVLRAALRSRAAELPPGAYLIGARPPAAALDGPTLRHHLEQALAGVLDGPVPHRPATGAGRD